MANGFTSRERRGLIGIIVIVLALTFLSFWLRTNSSIPEVEEPLENPSGISVSVDSICKPDSTQNKIRQENVNNKDKSKKRYNKKKKANPRVPARDPFEGVPTAR